MIIFGTLITQIRGRREVVSLSLFAYLMDLSYIGRVLNQRPDSPDSITRR